MKVAPAFASPLRPCFFPTPGGSAQATTVEEFGALSLIPRCGEAFYFVILFFYNKQD